MARAGGCAITLGAQQVTVSTRVERATRWSFAHAARRVPAGRYILIGRATDPAGNSEHARTGRTNRISRRVSPR